MIFLLKSDLETKDHITDAELQKWTEANPVNAVFRCSAKNNQGLHECVGKLLELMREAGPPVEAMRDSVDVSAPVSASEQGRRCAC